MFAIFSSNSEIGSNSLLYIENKTYFPLCVYVYVNKTGFPVDYRSAVPWEKKLLSFFISIPPAGVRDVAPPDLQHLGAPRPAHGVQCGNI